MSKEIKNFRGGASYLSNLNESAAFEYDGNTFKCAEAAFQYARCADSEEAKKFIPMGGKEAEKAAKSVVQRENWEEIQIDVMKDIIHAKFQNPDLRNKLIGTTDSVLIDTNSRHDAFWGVDKETGQGENHLGKILMAEREALYQEMGMEVPTASEKPVTKDNPEAEESPAEEESEEDGTLDLDDEETKTTSESKPSKSEYAAGPVVDGVQVYNALYDEVLRGTGFENGKIRVQEYYETMKAQPNHPTTEELAEFLKKEYGVGGHSGEGKIQLVDYSSKGIVFSFENGEKFKHSWYNAATAVEAKLEEGTYLSDKEKEKWQAIKTEKEVAEPYRIQVGDVFQNIVTQTNVEVIGQVDDNTYTIKRMRGSTEITEDISGDKLTGNSIYQYVGKTEPIQEKQEPSSRMITDEDLISKILSNDKGYSSHNKVIASYFASHQESAERAEYMKSIVSKNHTWFKLDGNTAGYQASDSKMTLYMIPQSALDDDSNDNQTKELSLSWNEVAQKMSAILEKDIQEAVIQHEKDDAALKAAMAKPTNLVKAEMELLVQVQEIGVNADGAAYKKATGTFLSEEQVNALIEMDFDFNPEKTLEGYRLQQEKRQKVHAETVKEESEEILTEQEPEEIVSEMETPEAEKITGEATEETTVIDQPLVKEIVNEAPIEEPDEEKPSVEEISAEEPEEPEEPKNTPEQKKSETKPSMEEYLEKHKATAESVEQVLTGEPEEPEHQEPVIEEPVKTEPSAEEPKTKTEFESVGQPEETQETEKAQEETIKEENHQESPTSVEVSAAPKPPQPESQPAPPQKAAPAKDPYRYIVSSYENGTVGFKISDGNQFIEATRNSEKGQGYDYYMSTVPTDLKAFTFMLKKNLCAIAGKEPNTNNAIVTFNVNMLYQTSRSDMQAYADINNIPNSKIAQAQQQYELCKQTQSELVSMMKTLGIKDVKNGIVDLIEDKARAEFERVRYTFAREDNGYLTCYDIDMNTIDKEKGTVITRLNDDGRDKTVEVSLIDIVNKGLLEAVLYTDAMNKEQAAQKNIEASYDNCPLLQTAISQSYSLVLGTADRKLITANPAKHIEPYICAIDLQRIPPELLNQMLETNVCALMERLDERLIRAVVNPDAIKAIQPEQIDKYEKVCKVSEAERFEAKHKFDLYQNAYTEVQSALQGLPAINSVPVVAELIADRINALNAETRTPYRFRHVPESTRKGISLENKVIDYDIKPSKEPDRKIDVLVSDASQNTYGDNFRVPVLVSSIQKRGVVQAACEKRDKDLAREDNQETKG